MIHFSCDLWGKCDAWRVVSDGDDFFFGKWRTFGSLSVEQRRDQTWDEIKDNLLVIAHGSLPNDSDQPRDERLSKTEMGQAIALRCDDWFGSCDSSFILDLRSQHHPEQRT